jgi:hypothetical protein
MTVFLLFLLFIPASMGYIPVSACPKFCHCSEGILSQPNEMRIYCEYPAKIEDFEGFPFAATKTLTLYCNGTGNGTTDFVKDKFANFTNLKHLAIDNCKTEVLEAGTFNGLTGLRSLKLLKLKIAPNATVNFTDDIFVGLTSLQV